MPEMEQNRRPGEPGGPGGPGERRGREPWMEHQVGGVGRRHGKPVFVQPGEGLQLDKNGDLIVQLMAHPGDTVEVSIGNQLREATRIPMTDEKGNGLFSAHIAKGDMKGQQCVNFSVNGVGKLNVMAPMVYFANSLSNYAEFPDPETDALIAARTDIQHGMVSHAFLPSATYGKMMSCVVYTPPGYSESGPYPVLYFVHECAENQLAWTDAARVNYLFDNLIADGACKPFLMVEIDCTMSLGYHDKEDFFEGFPELEQYLIQDCIPYIESHFRVQKDKWCRAIAGIGLGAAQAGYIGLRNTDVFGGLGLFTAFWVSAEFHDHGKADPIYDAAEALGKHPDALRVFYRAEGDRDMHYVLMKKENELIDQLGISAMPGYRFETHHGVEHSWGSYRRSFRDFLPMMFQKTE
ncbi:MAG: hypothetical protein LUG45_02905 [Clostridiales bacterium]|nr:hypothetical protein [Clostridiales bacterium]